MLLAPDFIYKNFDVQQTAYPMTWKKLTTHFIDLGLKNLRVRF